MLTFTLAISFLTTSNLPLFIDLTFQVAMQYFSLQHRTLLLSTTGCCIYFGSIPSFSLELFLPWFPVAYWAPTDLGSSSSSVLSFCLFILFMGFSRQEYWSGLPFPSPVDHILSGLSTMTHLIRAWHYPLTVDPQGAFLHMCRVSLGEGHAPHFSTLAWKIPWAEEPGRLQSMGLLRVGHDWVTSLSLFTFMHWRRQWQPTPVFLPGESQGWGSLVGCRLRGRTESDTTEVT